MGGNFLSSRHFFARSVYNRIQQIIRLANETVSGNCSSAALVFRKTSG